MKINRIITRPHGVIWTVVAALLWSASPVTALADEVPEDELIDFLAGEVPKEAQLEKKVVGGTERITISLDDVLLEDAVRMFAQTTDANIIATSGMMAGRRVTVNLTDVDWRPALRSILEIHDLALVERTPGSGVYSITEPRPDAPVPTLVQTFFLNYTTTSEVRDTIQSMLQPGASLTVFPSRNALVVRAQESNLAEVEKLITELDLPARQVLIETRIMELTDDARRTVGIDWSVLEGYRVGLTDMSRVFQDERSRVRTRQDRGIEYDLQGRRQGDLIMTGTEGELIRAGEFESWAAQPNFDGSFTDVQWLGAPVQYRLDERGQGSGYEWTSDRVSRRAYSDVMTAVLSPADFSLVLSALHRTDGVTMVSNPKMLVTSGSTNAFFAVGEREPIIREEIQRATVEGQQDITIAYLDTSINTDIIRQGYLETGIDLRVVATVKTADHIEADIRPSLRRKVDEKSVAGNTWPVLSVKEIDTSFTLRSGQTVAIGGLTQSHDDKRTTSVPILGSIPIIGRLFRHEQDVKAQVETIIFVTLSVADPDLLEREAGIPQDAQLVHTRMIRERADRAEFNRQLRQLQEAQAASEAAAVEFEEEVVPDNAPQPEPIEPATRPAREPILEPVPRGSRNDQPVPR